jgi:hypothetical protein
MSFPATKESEGEFAVNRGNILAGRLTEDGTPLGNANVIGDYSVTPGLFWAEVPAGQVWRIVSIVVYIAGAGNITANGYGPIPALTTGVTVAFETSLGAPLIPPPPATIKSNGDYQSIGFVQDTQDTGAGINHVTFTQRFQAAFSSPVTLEPTERVVMRPADNLTALTSHIVTVTGHWLSKL